MFASRNYETRPIPLHATSGFMMHAAFLRWVLPILAIVVVTMPARAEIGDWIRTDSVAIRLVATHQADGQPAAALEIVLEPGWKTYWRTPGEGGLPPMIDFSGSRNLASASVGFPPPSRYNDGYTVTNVYEGRVVFPITIEPTVAEVPVTIDIAFDLGVCETICIPMHVDMSLTMARGSIDDAALAIVEEGRTRLPSEPTPGVFAVTSVVAAGEGDRGQAEFVAEVVVPQAFGTELFVEGPEGWYPIAPHQIARDGNRLTFAFGFDVAEDADLSGAPVRFTLVSEGRAIEQQLALP